MKNSRELCTLNNGLKIPCVGFGTYNPEGVEYESIIMKAIEVGYRYFDTASYYQTEVDLGNAIRNSGVAREEIFISSKLWLDEMGYENAKEAFRKTLERLKTDYLDLYLIHWPRPNQEYKEWKELDVETWRALEELYKSGQIRGIGLSNFLPHHIENIVKHATVKPVVNQLEIHPGFSQEVTVNYCKEHDIRVQAWSPLGRRALLEDVLIKELAVKYGVTPAQICLRYLIQKRIIPLPKSSTEERMIDNLDIFSYSIHSEDMYRLETMPPTTWLGSHPDFNIPKG